MDAVLENREEKLSEFGFGIAVDVSLDSDKGVFRRYHVGNSPCNFTDPLGLMPLGPYPDEGQVNPRATVPFCLKNECLDITDHIANYWKSLSRREKCKKLLKYAFFIPCTAGGFAVGDITLNPWLGFGTSTACKAFFRVFAIQICPEEEPKDTNACQDGGT